MRISFEFFPAKTDAGIEKLRNCASDLAALNPEFFSVTFGAGGSTQERTQETVFEIAERTGICTAPHISCISSTKAELSQMLDQYVERGVNRLVTLRGDVPGHGAAAGGRGEMKNANELVSFIREHSGDHFQIEVAAYPEYHPESDNPAADMQHFVNKVNCGADAAITQYFFNADAYFRFVDDAVKAGVEIPIYPGIMPITNYTQLARFSKLCGAEIPRWIALRLAAYEDDMDSLRAFGQDVVADLCQKLAAGGAPGLHFYTLNQTGPSTALAKPFLK